MDDEQTIVLSADALVSKIKELREFVSSLRTVEQKVNIDQMAASFDDEQTATFKTIQLAIGELDTLIQENWDSSVAQVATAMISVLSSDTVIRRNYLMETDKKAKRIEADADLVEAVKQAKRMKSDIIALHQLLTNMGMKLPKSLYKDGRERKGGGKGEPLLDLPRIEDVSEAEEVSKRGRALRTETIVLGTFDNENDYWYYMDPEILIQHRESLVHWHEANNIGDVFKNLYGSVRSDHNQFGLFKACEKKGNIQITKGWTEPIEYAGKLWVAKPKQVTDKD